LVEGAAKQTGYSAPDRAAPIMMSFHRPIVEYLGGRDAQHSNALLIQPCVSPLVMQSLRDEIMCCSVYLDCQLGGGAVEIQNVRSGRILAAKMLRQLFAAQLSPKNHLRQGHFSP
jgi:hypothetical protein